MEKYKILELRNCLIKNLAPEKIDLEFSLNENVMIVFTGDESRNSFLDVLYGFNKPDSGEILYDNKEYQYDYDHLKNLRKKIALISTFGNMISNLTIYENIQLPLLSIPDLKKKEIPEIIDINVRRFELEGIINKLPDSLSDFDKIKVDFARGIGMGAKVFILNNLYEKLQKKDARDFFKNMIPELPLVISLSKSERGIEFCDRIIILDEEGVIYNGSTKNFGKIRRNKK